MKKKAKGEILKVAIPQYLVFGGGRAGGKPRQGEKGRKAAILK